MNCNPKISNYEHTGHEGKIIWRGWDSTQTTVFKL